MRTHLPKFLHGWSSQLDLYARCLPLWFWALRSLTGVTMSPLLPSTRRWPAQVWGLEPTRTGNHCLAAVRVRLDTARALTVAWKV